MPTVNREDWICEGGRGGAREAGPGVETGGGEEEGKIDVISRFRRLGFGVVEEGILRWSESILQS